MRPLVVLIFCLLFIAANAQDTAEAVSKARPDGLSCGMNTLRFRNASLFLRITYARLSRPPAAGDSTAGSGCIRSAWKPAVSPAPYDPEWHPDITPFLTEKSPSEERSKSELRRTLQVIRLKDLSDREYQWLYGLGGQIIMGIMTSGR